MTPTEPMPPHAGHRPDGWREDGSHEHQHGLGGARFIRFEQAIDIGRPIEEVFAYLADFTNIPRWNYYVENVRQLTPGQVGVGTTFEQQRRTDRQRYEVTVHVAPRLLAITTLRGERPAFHRHFELEGIGPAAPAGATGVGGALATRVTDRWELDLGYLLPLQRLAAHQVKAAVGDNLTVLKRLLEAHQPR
jgi:uncharacterized protein YndB with AHSA1/START domain